MLHIYSNSRETIGDAFPDTAAEGSLHIHAAVSAVNDEGCNRRSQAA